MAGFFLKMIGAADMPLLAGVDVFDVGGVSPTVVSFPVRQFPKPWTGDERLIYYAVGGTKTIFAAAQLTGAPTAGAAKTPGDRWPHWAPVRFDPTTVIRDLEWAPRLALVDIALQEAVTKDLSWVQMTARQYDDACSDLRRYRLRAPASARSPLQA